MNRENRQHRARFNLADRPAEMPELAGLISNLAIDHYKTGAPVMTGREVLQWFDVREYRRGHVRFASTIYRKTRWAHEITFDGISKL